jgi:putative ABC transport system permease protein
MFVAFKEIRRSLGRFSLLTMAVALLVLLLLFFQAVAGTLTAG